MHTEALPSETVARLSLYIRELYIRGIRKAPTDMLRALIVNKGHFGSAHYFEHGRSTPIWTNCRHTIHGPCK